MSQRSVRAEQVQVLRLRQPVDRTLASGDVHAYTIALESGQILLAVVEQRGIDLVVSVFDPRGTKVAEIDSPNGALGPEPVTIEAKVSGIYRLEVRPLVKETSGQYEARIEGILTTEQYLERLAKAQYDSPRLFRLWQELRAEGPPAIERFWQEMKDKTPLVEPFPEASADVWVTFLWRGDAMTSYVGLIGGPPGPTWEKPLSRMEQTDVWYLTARMPSDARFGYSLLAGTPPAYRATFGLSLDRNVSARTDPLNPHQAYGVSTVELPNAPVQAWAQRREGVPRGRLAVEAIRSEKLAEDRRFGVYTPASYDAKAGPYGLLLVFDGETYGLDEEPRVPTPLILDNLIASGKIPAVVAVLVANQGTRERDLGASATFADFLAEELVPRLRQKYAVGSDPSRVIVAGSSLGGLCAAFTALRHPAVFGNVLSQSGAFWHWSGFGAAPWTYATEPGSLIRDFVGSPRQALRFYLEAGRFESGWPAGILEVNRHLRDVLEAKGYPVTYAEFDGGHDYICWRGSLADGLIALTAERPRP